MGKKTQLQVRNTNISYLTEVSINANLPYLTELSLKAKSKNAKCLDAYRTKVTSLNRLLLNHHHSVVNTAAFSVLTSDYQTNLPTYVEGLLLELPVLAVHEIKDLSSELCYYDAILEEVPTTTIAECVKTFGHYLSKVCLVLAFVFASSALFAQRNIPEKWEKPFSEKVSEFWSHSNLCESTILVLFENQLKKDLDIDVDFYCGELIMIVNDDLILPEHWQESILVVLNDERFIEDNIVKY